ncbi:PadR family transcriptional regulator [Ktedonobacter sp. SOSP1-85]|uniref:PadR family transcriptional regulator n=1 Tax=Ktedonobacter sp. SOSP1-85 TaxID=2778367 RepID=UPI001914FEE4|nr:PadR family transcriptional regulator [Ktedonobacter sp. SOSP1-85]
MTTLEYKLLGMLARHPMSGYDLASVLKQRVVPFGPISHTQIYPALASLERKGLVRYHIVEQQAVRPDKKVYELTEEGRAALRQWVESPTPLVFLYDEFFLKAYSLWLADPERMEERFREQAQLHQEKLEFYEQALQSKQLAISAKHEKADFFEGMDVLFQYIIGYEHNYLAWCQSMLEYLEQRKHQHGQEEGQA